MNIETKFEPLTPEFKQDFVEEIKHMLNFPFAQICRHSVALNLLSLLEKHGYTLPNGLARAVCQGSNGDEEAMELLKQL